MRIFVINIFAEIESNEFLTFPFKSFYNRIEYRIIQDVDVVCREKIKY